MTHQPTPASTPTAPAGAHDGVPCETIEAILADQSAEIDVLRDQVDLYARVDATRHAEMDTLRQSEARLRALVTDLSKKARAKGDLTAGLDEQVRILIEELAAAEADTVPVGTLTFAALTQDQATAAYRRASRITRGPVPPAITEAVAAAADDIRAAMEAAAAEALQDVVRRAVRRRRAAQRPRRTTRRAAPRRSA